MTIFRSVRVRLVLLAALFLLFAGWVARLGYLAFNKPIVVARTELLVADVVIIARVEDPSGPVKVEGVCWPQDAKSLEAKELSWQPGDSADIAVTNLDRCRADWTGPGQYILPLLRTGTTFEVANPTGYPQAQVEEQLRNRKPPHSVSPGYYPGPPGENMPAPHIYPATRETEAQVEQVFGKPWRR
jgi:hypothetical protein